MDDSQLANDPAARTPTGEIKDQSTAPLGTTTESPAETKPDATTADTKPAAAPEAYAAFTAPEGQQLDTRAIEQATPIFKELGLDQSQAQKLVDLYATISKSQADTFVKQVEDMRADWTKQIKADPVIGGKLDTVKAEFGKALTSLGDPKLANDFKAALDFTGAGDHPAVIKAMYKLSQLINEGTHVTGTGPSDAGQRAPGTTTRPSAAAAMYPNLANGQA